MDFVLGGDGIAKATAQCISYCDMIKHATPPFEPSTSSAAAA